MPRTIAGFVHVVLLVGLSSAPAQALRIWVDPDSATAEPLGANCLITPTDAGGSPDKPLKGGGQEDALDSALKCGRGDTAGFHQLLNEDVEIIVRCTAPVGGFCTYLLDDNKKDLPYAGSKTRLLRADPPGMVKLLAVNNTPITMRGKNWTVQGFYFDGNQQHARASFIRLGGTNNTLKKNIIENSQGNCIAIGNSDGAPTDSVTPPNTITIQNNIIRRCFNTQDFASPTYYPGDGATCTTNSDCAAPSKCVELISGAAKKCVIPRRESHCIHNYNASGVTITGNDITDCGGDGYQTENYLSSSLQDPHTTAVATGVSITRNRFWANAYGAIDGPAGVIDRTVGENAIDIKRSGAGLVISDNIFRGYRASKAKCNIEPKTNCKLDAERSRGYIRFSGTGDDDKGAAITLHGDVTPCSSQFCALVEGNDISDSQIGISVGADPSMGNPQGVVVRGNVIHDQRGIGFDRDSAGNPVASIVPRMRGMAIEFASGPEPGAWRDLVYRNTIVNIPGDTLRLENVGCTFYPCVIRGQTIIKNNLIARTSGVRTINAGSEKCSLNAPANSTDFNFDQNAFWNVRSDSGVNVLNQNGSRPKLFDSLDFTRAFTPLLLPSADSPPADQACTVNAECLSGNRCVSGYCEFDDKLCGATERSVQANPRTGALDAMELDVLDRNTLADPAGTFEYRLRQTPDSATIEPDHEGTDDTSQYSRARSGFGAAYCGVRPEFGADEQCATLRTYLRKNSATNGTEKAELFAGTDWWSSPDVGFVPFNRPDPSLTAPLQHWPSVRDLRQSPRSGSFFVRVFSDATLASTDQILVRVWGSQTGTAQAFPTRFDKLVEAQVQWCSSTSCSGTGWRWVAGTGNSRLYALSFSGEWENGVLRAEVQHQAEPPPQANLHVTRSNNLAQSNVLASPFPQNRLAVPVVLERDYPGSPNPSVTLTATGYTNWRNRTWLFLPNNAAELWIDDGRPFPPAVNPSDPRLIAIPYLGSVTKTVNLPEIGGQPVQLLIDVSYGLSYNYGVSGTEYVEIKETGQEAVRVYLTRPGLLRESFEWGIPTTWTATGLWTATDQFANPGCGSADTGRKAAGFVRLETCTYESIPPGSRMSGELVSPRVAWGPNAKLSFSAWAEVEANANFDTRRVLIRRYSNSFPYAPPTEILVSNFSAPFSGIGPHDDWTTFTFDLSSAWMVNTKVEIVFSFDTVNGSNNNKKGWHIDDVELVLP